MYHRQQPFVVTQKRGRVYEPSGLVFIPSRVLVPWMTGRKVVEKRIRQTDRQVIQTQTDYCKQWHTVQKLERCYYCHSQARLCKVNLLILDSPYFG